MQTLKTMLTGSLLLLSALATTACNALPVPNMGLPPTQTAFHNPLLRGFGTFSAPTQWYETLKPELKAYYAEAQGLTGEPLFLALNKITARNHRPEEYGAAKSYMYAVADNLQSLRNESGVTDVYSQLFIAGSGGNGNDYRERGDANQDGVGGDFINCEHTWPQSFFNKNEPMRGDIHHLFPTLSHPNNRRGHFPFGMASEGKVVYSTSSGSKLIMTGGRSNPMLSISADNEQPNDLIPQGGNAVFEPNDPQKGNTARAMQYFYLRYFNQNIRSGAYNRQQFWVSRVPMFRQWAQMDPPDVHEIQRHELVAQKQGNRNPFVDIPNLAEILGDAVMQKY